jgi:NAD(P)-dependent dehydrogenase (short-subunit alcohol dehydrogenase family)
MSNHPVALILGAGPNVGQHVSRALVAKGYKVALASRSGNKGEDAANQLDFKVDLSIPSSVPELFVKVKEALGIPSVVVYNGDEYALIQLHNHADQTKLARERPTTPRIRSPSPLQISRKTSISIPPVSLPRHNRLYLGSRSCLSLYQRPSSTPEIS